MLVNEPAKLWDHALDPATSDEDQYLEEVLIAKAVAPKVMSLFTAWLAPQSVPTFSRLAVWLRFFRQSWFNSAAVGRYQSVLEPPV